MERERLLLNYPAKLFFLFALLLCALSSCSFEKRLYTCGYYTNWSSSTPRDQAHIIPPAAAKKITRSATGIATPEQVGEYSEQIAAPNTVYPNHPVSRKTEPARSQKNTIQATVARADRPPAPKDDRVLAPAIKISLYCLLAAIVLPFILFYGLVTFMGVMVIFLVFAVLLILGILVYTFAIIGLLQVKNHRDQYKGKYIAELIVAAISVLLFLSVVH
jgi:hypothetical protein